MSEEVRHAVQSQFDTSDDIGASWILWSEIVASNWRVELEVPQSWALLFELMRQLADTYSADRVRLVIWFDPGYLLPPSAVEGSSIS